MLGKKVIWGLAALLLGSSVGLGDVIDYGGNLMGDTLAPGASVTLNWDNSTFHVTDKTSHTVISGTPDIYSPYTVTIDFGAQVGDTLNVSHATVNLVEKDLSGTTTLASYSGSFVGGGFDTSNSTFDLKFSGGGDWSGNYTTHTFMGMDLGTTYNADLVVAPVPSSLFGAAGLVAGLFVIRGVRRRGLV